jgi:hypothetical protein
LTPFPLQNKTGAEVSEELSKRLLALGATQSGHFLVDGDIFENCKEQQTDVKQQKTMNLYLFSIQQDED